MIFLFACGSPRIFAEEVTRALLPRMLQRFPMAINAVFCETVKSINRRRARWECPRRLDGWRPDGGQRQSASGAKRGRPNRSWCRQGLLPQVSRRALRQRRHKKRRRKPGGGDPRPRDATTIGTHPKCRPLTRNWRSPVVAAEAGPRVALQSAPGVPSLVAG